jgi:hypothetical protein
MTRQNIKNFAFRQGVRNCTTISTWGKVKAIPDLWEGPTRMRAAGYTAIAEAVSEAVTALTRKRVAKNPSEGLDAKRPRLSSQTGPMHGVSPASGNQRPQTADGGQAQQTRGGHQARGQRGRGSSSGTSNDGWIRGHGGRGGRGGRQRGWPWRGFRGNTGH